METAIVAAALGLLRAPGGLAIKQKGVALGNYTAGRSGHKISAIVVHISTASLQSADNTFANPQSHVSAHYGNSDTETHQYVQDADTAWHAGIEPHLLFPNYAGPNKPTWPGLMPFVNPNLYTLGIENEGTIADFWRPAKVARLAALIALKAQEYGFPVDPLHVTGHHAIWAGHQCPGPLCPLDEIIAIAAEVKNNLVQS